MIDNCAWSAIALAKVFHNSSLQKVCPPDDADPIFSTISDLLQGALGDPPVADAPFILSYMITKSVFWFGGRRPNGAV